MIQLTEGDKRFLLDIARQTLLGAFHKSEINLEESQSPLRLEEKGASFVTLTIRGQLRGCIGTLSAYQSLVQDVCEHVLAAAFEDPRFPPLEVSELDLIDIEISYLTPPEELHYADADDLMNQLISNEDGVILSDGFHRATYLPQVWEQLPEKKDFLNSLCRKMGVNHDLWRKKNLSVKTYKVIHFSENEFAQPS